MNLFKKYFLLVLLAATFNCFAADQQAVTVDTTPQPAEGPLTLQQIPPISEVGKPLEMKEQAAPAAANPEQPQRNAQESNGVNYADNDMFK